MNVYLRKYVIFLYPLFPFFSFIVSLFNLKNKLNRIVFILFYGLFGYVHRLDDSGADAFRKAEAFVSFPNEITLNDVWSDYLLGKTHDIFQTSFFVILRMFTDNPHVMLMCVGLILGVLFSLIIKWFLKDVNENQYTSSIYILVFFLVVFFNPILIGGIRNGIALGCFTFSAIRFLIEKKNIWLIPILCCPLIHFSFFITIPFVIFARYFKIKIDVLFYLVIIVMIMSLFISSDFLSNIFGNINIDQYSEAVAGKVEANTSAQALEVHKGSLTVFLMKVQLFVGRLYIIPLLFYFRRIRKKGVLIKKDEWLYYIMLYSLLFTYMMTILPVVGDRYLPFSQLLVYYFLLRIYICYPDNKVKNYIKLIPFVYIINLSWCIFETILLVRYTIFFAPLPLLIIGELI